jgi:hypothetical protein
MDSEQDFGVDISNEGEAATAPVSGVKVTVSATAPPNPKLYDIWIDIS